MYGRATLDEFKRALGTTNAIVGYVGYGLFITSGINFASGTCFAGNNCLFDPALTNVGGNQYEAATGYTWDTSQTSITPKAKVVFLGLCGMTDQLVSFWNV